MMEKAFQDYYDNHLSICYGCGRLNEYGLKIKSYWSEDGTTKCIFTPKPYHTAIRQFVYGGLIASVIDCHGTASAAAAAHLAENRPMDQQPKLRYVTGNLTINYLKPTPIDTPMVLIGNILEIKKKKVIVHIDVFSNESLCVNGDVTAIQAPKIFLADSE